MEWLRSFWLTNWTVLFAVYGVMFFTLGIALAVQSLKKPRLSLGRYLPWLAAFGIVHAFVEWGYIFLPGYADLLSPAAVEVLSWFQLALLALSFVLLLQFGLRGALRLAGQKARWFSLAAPLVAVAALILGLLPHWNDPPVARVGIEIWTRYLLAVPGSLLGAWAIQRAAREAQTAHAPPVRRGLHISAASLAGYALLNLFTPAHDLLLAPWLNYEAMLAYVGVPVQAWRTLVAAGVLYGMLLSLPVFDQESEEARLQWMRHTLAAQEEERRRIAHELHDEAIQALVVLCRQLEEAEALAVPNPAGSGDRLAAIRGVVAEAKAQAEELITHLRDFARDLRPPALDELGMVTCIRRALEETQQRAGLRWDLRVAGAPVRLEQDRELALYRIAREAIRNVERHAQAGLVTVDLRFGTDSVILRVRDDGVGMGRWPVGNSSAESLGVLGMQERAELLGGDLQIESRPGRGTTVTLHLPVRPGVPVDQEGTA
ncbi:MAG: sensor histidine kinase [Bacillota bacterium]